MILLDQAGAAASRSWLLPPSRLLEPFIQHFWIQQAPENMLDRPWRVVPDACPHLISVVSNRESQNPTTTCTLVGPRSRYVDVSAEGRVFTCGARLHPGTLPLLTQFPAWDFTDQGFPVGEVFGAKGRALLGRLGELGAVTTQAIDVMAEFLGACLRGHDHLPLPPTRHYKVQELAALLTVPVRTLHARIMQDVGLAPKRLLRIERLHRVLNEHRIRPVSWGQAATTHGFADQAHMIREFRDLLGESPAAWSSRRRLPISSRQSTGESPSLPDVAER